MIFRQLIDATSSTYTYLIAHPESGEAALIDSVFEQHPRDEALIRELGLDLKWALETHVHADHVTGAALARRRFGAKIAVSAKGGASGADRLLEHGDVVDIGGMGLEVRETPGHTNGCIAFVASEERMAFTGDTLLIRGAGRTDFQEGSAETMFQSIRQQILTLPEDFLLYPAHDYNGRTVTTVAEERDFNPRFGGKANEGDFVGFMKNLNLPHPKAIDVAVPANLKVGEPEAAPETPKWAPVIRTYAGIPEIDPQWVLAHRDKVHLLDVRDEREVADPEQGSIDGAVTIPLAELNDRLEEIRDRFSDGRPIVAFCRSGARSAQAYVLLKRAGVTQEVVNLSGGILRWRDFQSA